MALYDGIGKGYARIRQADPRLARPIWQALGDARTVINVGAGAGSYEPNDREVTAVEPSELMIAQRSPGAAPAVRAAAEGLPFDDGSFDAGMAILTLHHWSDVESGLRELARVVTRRIVVVTFDPEVWREQWIVRDYLPEIMDDVSSYPSPARVAKVLPVAEVRPLLAPRDCTDRMFATLWARPELYLDPQVRAGTSVWHELPRGVSDRALAQLRLDLASGAWDERYGHLRTTPEWDVGLRLIRAEL
ncbi:MAG TPA: methyltransferase domain-containing protein [Gaiellaceae bacterium]|nr:methyltransferase domain-containing protein [Gaiellaceae bacterium]